MRFLLLLLALLAFLPAFASPPDQPETVFIVLRHAEKDRSAGIDPPLLPEGEARARLIAERLKAVKVAAVLTTDRRRTRATADPIARQAGVSSILYDGATRAGVLAARLRDDYPGKIVVVIGHSDTVPDIVSALCRCRVAHMPDSEYDRWSEVHIRADGHARLLQESY